MARGNVVEVFASTSYSTGGSPYARTNPVPLGASTLVLLASATTGAGTCDLVISWSHDGSTWFIDQAGSDAMAQFNGTDKDLWDVPVKGAWFKVVATVASAALTFSVHAVGVP